MKTICKTAAFIVPLFICCQTFGQAPGIEWQKSLGGSGYEKSSLTLQTRDGGYIVAGTSSSIDGDVTINYGGFDIWVIKLSHSGNIEWQKSYGGTSDEGLIPGYYAKLSIDTTYDGGFVIASTSNSNDGDLTSNYGGYDIWIFKTDSIGNLHWQKSFGGSSDDIANSIQQTIDGGYVVAGYSESNDGDVSINNGLADYWLLKTDDTGNIEWQKSYGGIGYDRANEVKSTLDGGYVLVGDAYSFSNILKIDSIGNVLWQKKLPTSINTVDLTNNGGYIVAGRGFKIIRLDSLGAILWQTPFLNAADSDASCLKQNFDDSYIIAGYAGYPYSKDSADYFIQKIDSNGSTIWHKSLGGSNPDFITSIFQTHDGEYIIAGTTYSSNADVMINHGLSDYWIVKLKIDSSSIPSAADFSTIYTNGCSPHHAAFNISNYDSAYNYFWDFGDGTLAQMQGRNIFHIYTLPGIYTVKLKVGFAGAIQDSVIKIDYIHVHPEMIANFSFDSVFVCNSSISLMVNILNGLPPFTYHWSNLASSNPIIVDTVGFYSVFVQDSVGCTAFANVLVDYGACGVFPGDANSDGIANNNDILAIGVGYGSTGPIRQNASIVWVEQLATDWNDSLANGANYKHVDCNGDGVIDSQDTTAVSLNYGLTHNKTGGMTGSVLDPMLYYDIPDDSIFAGQVVDVPIMLGTASTPANNVYGIAFTINYNTNVAENAVMLDGSNSWLGTNLLTFMKDFPASGMAHSAITRINQSNVSGFGQIGSVKMSMKDDISGKDFIQRMLKLSFSDVNVISYDETEIPVFAVADSGVVYQDVTGVDNRPNVYGFRIYPNPANSIMIVEYSGPGEAGILITDILGRKAVSRTISSNHTEVDVSHLQPGVYLVSVSAESRRLGVERIVVF